MYPISDLTAFCRRTTGDVPPKLVGASTTVVGNKMYLYGGRLVSERKMVSDIYQFDLETFRWDKLYQAADEDVPQARYFHSADTWKNHLIIFGGMAIQPQSDNPEDLCVLNDVRLFDLSTYRWVPAAEHPPTAPVPKARYAHLSSITSNRLFIIGGQDLNNVWLDDVHVYDLVSQAWVQRRDYPRHCGTYRSVAVTADRRVRLPQEEGQYASSLGQPGTRFNADQTTTPTPDVTQTDSLIHLPYSAEPTDEYPCDIFLFSNYNFTDVQRELEVFSPLPGFDFTVSDRSSSMTGAFFPPGLRFPTGAILGTHFIIAGTYLSQTFQSFSIWALDLVSMTWNRVDPGSTLSGTSGSWFRSCLWPEANRFLVFGNRHGNLVEDYNRRLLSWDHVICIDLEAFGIYQPPPLALELPQQELGLAALEEGVLADFEIICDDGRKIKCSRKLLEDRWPWFKEQRRVFIQAASRAIEATPSTSGQPPLPVVRAASDKDEPRPDPRLTPRAFHLSEPYPVTLAFLQYLYSMSLITPLQHAPAVLSQLLLLSATYEMPHLQSLVKHAMHRALTFATSVGIYGVSTLCNCRSLQIRALRVVMAYSQKRPAGSRARTDRDGSGGNHRGQDPANGAPGPSNGHTSVDKGSAARPRGMSDASYMRGPSSDVIGGSNLAISREYGVDWHGLDELRAVASESDIAFLMQASVDVGLQDFVPGGRGFARRASTPAINVSETGTITAPISSTSSTHQSAPSSPLVRQPQTSPTIVNAQISMHELRVSLPPSSHVNSQPSSARSSFQRQTLSRQRSAGIMSVTSEDDILALAEILAPAVDVEDDYIAEFIPAMNRAPSQYGSLTAALSQAYSSDRHSISSRRSAGTATSTETATSPSSDSHTHYDEIGDGNYLTASTSVLSSFHLPRHSRPRYPSDTPSLVTTASYSTTSLSTPPLSRASSFQQLNSPTSSNASSFLPTPIEPAASSTLSVIHERQRSEERLSTLKSISRSNMIQEHEPHGIEELDRNPELQDSTVRDRRGLPHLEIRTSSPDTIMPSFRPTSSPNKSADVSPYTSPQPSAKGGPFSRLFKQGKSIDALSPPGTGAAFNDPRHEAKLAKEEAKRAQKLAAKERRERLAREFQEKAKVQSPDARSLSSGESKRKAPTWEEEGAVFGSTAAWA